MKKIVSLVLATVLIISCFCVIAYAEDNLQSLALSVKQRLQIPAEYTSLVTERFNNGTGEALRLEWSTEDNKKSVYAEVTKSGIITSFYDTEVKNSRGISKFTKEQAIEMAKNWLKAVNPSIAEGYVFNLEDIHMGYGINISGERYVGAAKVLGDSVTIGLNSQTGKVANMNLRYTEEKFAVPENIITKELAKEKFGENTNLILAYLRADDKAIPVYIDYDASYAPRFGIDAVTGEKVETEKTYFRGFSAGGSNSAFKEDMKDEVAKLELTKEEIAELSKYDNYISETEGANKIKGISEFGVSAYSLERYSYNRNYGKEKIEDNVILSITLRKDEKYAHAELDAATGDIISFYQSNNYENAKEKIASEQADKIADKIAEKLAAGKEYKRASQKDNRDEISREIGYLEVVNGIPYLGSSMSVAVNKATGNVSSLSVNWEKEDISFESIDTILDLSGESVKYLDKSEYELVFLDLKSEDKVVYSDEGKPYEYVLVYQRVNAPYCINALTGDITTSTGETEKVKIEFYKDLEGHWAKGAITALVDNGYMSVEEESFRPNENITYKEAQEFMRMAGLYRNYDHKNDDEILDRQEAVKLMMCYAGYEKVGAIEDIYVPVFADWNSIQAETRGYVALAKGFKIIGGDQNGCFNPNAYMTRGAFAVMVYNYMNSGQLD